MNSCVAASEAVAPAKPAWRAVYSLGLGCLVDYGRISARQSVNADGREPGRE